MALDRMTQAHRRLLALGLSLSACTSPSSDDTTGSSGDESGDESSGDTGMPGGDVTPELLAGRGSCAEPTGAGTDHTGTITADETWTADASPHRIPSALDVLATVTIEPCAVVQIGAQVYVSVGDTDAAGAIVAHGEVSTKGGGDVDVRPVVFDRLDPSARWGQILVQAGGHVDLSIAALLHGGDTPVNAPGALVLQGLAGGTNTGELVQNGRLDRVLVADSASFGINLDAYGAFTDDSTQVWIEGSGSEARPYPLRIEPGVAHTLPQGLALTDNLRDEILIETSKTFMVDDTFVDRDAPYHVLGALYVAPYEDGAPVTLTIEPGVTVAFETSVGAGIVVGSTEARQGVLVADGTEDAPILLTSGMPTPAPGDWQGLFFRHTPGSGNGIHHARIEYAGGESGYSSFGCGPGDNDAAIIIEGQGDDDHGPDDVFIGDVELDAIAGTTVIVSGWTDDAGPDFSAGNTFGASTPDCKVSRPKRTGGGDVCDGGRDVCWG